MQSFVIQGGRPLSGTVRAAGNKNGALPILAATVLATEPVRLENVPRILPEGVTAVFETNSWPVLPIFQLIQQRGEISSEEMYEVFNMGIGLVVMVSAEDAEEVRAAIPEALVIGAIREWTGRAVELNGL